jgi:hypothetical protein
VESDITNTHRVEGFALEKCNAVSGDAQSKCEPARSALAKSRRVGFTLQRLARPGDL